MNWSMIMVLSLSGLEPCLDGRSRPNGPRGRGKGEPRSRTALERRRQRMRVGHRDGWSASPGLLPAVVVHGRKEDRTAFASARPLPRFSRGGASGRRCDVSPLALVERGFSGWVGRGKRASVQGWRRRTARVRLARGDRAPRRCGPGAFRVSGRHRRACALRRLRHSSRG